MAAAHLNVAFWNLYNLFEPGVVERGPATEAELAAKIDAIALAIGDWFGGKIHLIGITEVQNGNLAGRLMQRLHHHGLGEWRMLWEPAGSAELTGLGLLWRKGTSNPIGGIDRLDADKPTLQSRPRVLLANCMLRGAESPLIVALNHWKSRLQQGASDDRADRLRSARWLGDRLAPMGNAATVIAAGDFNAEAYEPPFSDVTLLSTRHFSSATWSGGTTPRLYNTSWRFLGEPMPWDMHGPPGIQEPRPKTSHDGSPSVLFDQLLVSRQCLLGTPLRLIESTVRYHTSDATAYRVGSGLRPRRWAWSNNAGVGVSDHFAILASFAFNP